MLLYKNISFVMMKRLFKEPNVIIIMVLSLCNWAIDIGRPLDSFSPVNGFVYMLCVNGFVLMDAVIIKSRYLMIGFGILFVALNVYNIYYIRLVIVTLALFLLNIAYKENHIQS